MKFEQRALTFRTFILIILFLITQQKSLSQPVGNFSLEGNEFFICFPGNYKPSTGPAFDTTHKLKIFIISEDSTMVTLYMPLQNLKKEIKIKSKTPEIIIIDSIYELNKPYIVSNNGIHIVSPKKIKVYTLNSRYQTSDATAIIPVSHLNHEYYAVSMANTKSFFSQAAILAIQDSTNVTILPSVELSNMKLPGHPIHIVLNKGETYLIKAQFLRQWPDWQKRVDDLTGTYIKADQKIAVFSGHECAEVPQNVFACNYLNEQMLPAGASGKSFIAGNLAGRTKYTLKIISTEDKNDIYINDKWTDNLRAGEQYEMNDQTENLKISTSKSTIVVQCTQGYQSADSIGDPMMMMLPPTNIYQKSHYFFTPGINTWNHYVSITAQRESLGSITLDGKAVSKELFKHVAGSEYYIAQVKIDYGYHEIKSNKPVGINIYGFSTEDGVYDAYGTM